MKVQLTTLGTLACLFDTCSAFILSAPVAARVRLPSALKQHDISVTLPGGEVRTVVTKDDQSILDALEAQNIEAPHSCRSGLCTE